MTDKNYYIFRITNVERSADDLDQTDYVIYKQKENVLHCMDKNLLQFQRISINSRKTLAQILLKAGIKEIFTKEPEQDEILSYPYEIEEKEDFQACMSDGNWYLTPHTKLTPYDIKFLRRIKIQVHEE